MRARSLILALAIATSPSGTFAQGTTALPIYTTEEAAADILEKRVTDHSMVTINRIAPLEPEQTKGFVGVGFKVTASGTQPNVTLFISRLSAAPFCKLPNLSLTTDRKDPTVVHVALTVRDWYAKKEKAATKVKRWQRVTTPSVPALEVMSECESLLPEDGAKITSFSVSDGTINLIGESHNANVGRSFGAKIFSSEELSSHRWVWMMRPVLDARKKDGSAAFRIQGQLKGDS